MSNSAEPAQHASGLEKGTNGHSDTELGDAEADTEEEPRLKYQRLGSDVADLLGKNAATCLCVSDKILALGTHSGTVHVLDYSGNEVLHSLENGRLNLKQFL